MPIEALEENETFCVPETLVGRGGSHYVLRVRGNSMIDEQIRDGDFVVVNERQRADNGEMVIALLNGTSATVKKYYRERDGRIRLQPANETMQPMYVHENDMKIQGIVVGVLAASTERSACWRSAGDPRPWRSSSSSILVRLCERRSQPIERHEPGPRAIASRAAATPVERRRTRRRHRSPPRR